MNLLLIDGVNPVEPASVEVLIIDIDSEESGRVLTNAEAFRDRIAVKRKLICKWNALNNREISQLLKAVRKPHFRLSYHDPESGNFETRTFYVGDRAAPICSAYGGEIIWKNVNMNFTEQ